MTSVATHDVDTDAADVRQARLAQRVARVRRRSGLDVEKALQIAGSVLLPTGLIVIFLGWWGASRTSYEFEQLPYLISGGMLGAAMSVVGGFLYFGYWLTRLVHDGQRQRADLAELLRRLDGRMAALEGVSTNGTTTVALVSTPSGTLVHRADCALVAGKAGLRRVDPTSTGLKGCKVCQPLGDGPNP